MKKADVCLTLARKYERITRLIDEAAGRVPGDAIKVLEVVTLKLKGLIEEFKTYSRALLELCEYVDDITVEDYEDILDLGEAFEDALNSKAYFN